MQIISKFIFLCFLLFSCSIQEETEVIPLSQNTSNYPIIPKAMTLPQKDFVIFEYDVQEHFYVIPEGEATSLSEEERLVGNEILAKKLEEYNTTQENIYSAALIKNPNFSRTKDEFVIYPERYSYQYIVVKNKLGEKILWVNAFYEEKNTLWKEQLVSVNDGGNSYFQAFINLSREELQSFQVNGEA